MFRDKSKVLEAWALLLTFCLDNAMAFEARFGVASWSLTLSPKMVLDGVASPSVTSCIEVESGADPAPGVEKNEVGGVLPDESKNLALVLNGVWKPKESSTVFPRSLPCSRLGSFSSHGAVSSQSTFFFPNETLDCVGSLSAVRG